jgi:hypothetical protein
MLVTGAGAGAEVDSGGGPAGAISPAGIDGLGGMLSPCADNGAHRTCLERS